MTRTAFVLSLGLGAAALALAAPVHAQQGRVCGPHDRVVERLAAVYGESRQSIGLGLNNSVVEIFASADTGTWTITVTAPGGPTCLVAAGEAYQHLAEALPNTDPPA